MGHGALRRAAHGRHPAAPRPIAEMATGEGKTLVATLPLYLNALPGQGRAPRHRQLLPRPPRLAVDGARLQVPRPHRRLHRRHRAGDAGAPRRVRVRHHVRHEQRVRLRLPARQHGACRSSSGCSAATSTRSSTKWTRCSSTKRARRSSSRARSATRATRVREHNAAVARLVRRQTRARQRARRATARRLLEADDDGRRRALKLYKAQLGQPEEQAPAEGAAGAGRQAARAEDGARAHRRSQAPGRQAAVPGHRGRPALRPRREGALGAPHRSRRRLHVADGPRRVRAARHLAARCTRSTTITSCTPTEKLEARRAARDRVRGEERAAATSCTSCCGRTRCTRRT